VASSGLELWDRLERIRTLQHAIVSASNDFRRGRDGWSSRQSPFEVISQFPPGIRGDVVTFLARNPNFVVGGRQKDRIF
jgi:hypothetical protein